MRMMIVTLSWRKTRSERCWHRRGNKNDKKFQRKNYVEDLEDRQNRRQLLRRRKFRAEVEELKLRTKCNRCGSVGHWARECPLKRAQSYQRGGCGNYFGRKNEYFSKRVEKEAHVCDWRSGYEPRSLGFFFESKHNSMLERVRRRREQRCSLLEKARKLRIGRDRVNGECEVVLNSSPGKGIGDTGCAKMMMASDTFKQYLCLFEPEGTGIHREGAREELFRVRGQRDKNVILVRGHSNEHCGTSVS